MVTRAEEPPSGTAPPEALVIVARAVADADARARTIAQHP